MIDNNKRRKTINSLKGMLCTLSLLTGLPLISSCTNSKLKNYYIVRDNNHNYICTKHKENIDDEEFISIIDKKYIGSICRKQGSFNYALPHHSLNQKFLNELQIFPLEEALIEENIDLSLLNTNKDIVSFAQSKELDKVVSNHFVRNVYYFHQHFKIIPDSKLKLFVHENDVYIGYDVSPDRDFNKNRYVYSISNQDVLQYTKLDKVDTYSIDMYLTEDNKRNKYLNYNEAIEIANKFNYNHNQKKLTKTP